MPSGTPLGVTGLASLLGETSESLAVAAISARLGATEPDLPRLCLKHAIDGEVAQAMLLSEGLEELAVMLARAASATAGKPPSPSGQSGVPATSCVRPR
jgi:hypothetical protein